jgi:hypothetical protein
MPTPTEKKIIQRRRAVKTGAILVPILERLLERECAPEDDEDFAFLDMLMRVRSTPREKGVFSPSMLGSCVRQAYFAKRNVEKHVSHSAQTNGYFLTGNFVHFKWQFALWKAHRAGMLELVMVPAEDLDYRHWGFFNGERLGIEVRVIDGEFGGTIDALIRVRKRIYVVDFKGINLIDFQRTVKKGAPIPYRRQIVGYSKIASKVLDLEIENALLVSECKAGPVSGTNSPLALHETLVPVAEFEADVKRRLKTLQWYDSRDELPEIECVSTRHMGFQECAFSRFCQDEVREAQVEHERRAAIRSGRMRVARSNGS